jgi:hypothetical protein
LEVFIVPVARRICPRTGKDLDFEALRQVLDGSESFMTGGHGITIFQCSDRARVAILHGSDAVGEVRGEAARDLKQLFKKHSDLHNAIAVEIVRTGKSSEPFQVQPCKQSTKGRKNTIQ